MKNIDLLAAYQENISKYSLLSAEEELSLAKEIQSGSKIALDKLVNHNLRLVIKIAKNYISSKMPILDIIQEGNIGLLAAAERFKASFNVRFSTYACWWIRQYIVRAIQNKHRSVRLPLRKEVLLTHVQKESFDFKLEHGKTPSPAELAQKLNAKIDDVLQLIPFMQQTVRLDSTIDESDSCCLLDFVADDSYNPETVLMASCDKAEIHKFLDECLDEREKNILLERLQLTESTFDADSSLVAKRHTTPKQYEKRSTLKTLATQYNVSPETVRQTELRAIRKLRKNAHILKKAFI